MTPAPVPIDDLLWTATRFSDVLRIDRRVVAQALETIPAQDYNGRKCWHVRDGCPAIYARAGVKGAKKNPVDMEPKDELDYYKAQREKIRLAADIGQMVMASDVERSIGEAFKTLAQTLDGLPDSLERSHGLAPAVISSIHASIDVARNVLYETLMSSLEAPNEN